MNAAVAKPAKVKKPPLPEGVQVLRRTFNEAKVRGKAKKEALHRDLLHSSLWKHYPWLLRRPFLNADGTVHQQFPNLDVPYRTKKQAEADGRRLAQYITRS